MKALVTGGAGFIGSNLVHRLVRDGHQVRVLDDLSTGSLENLGDVAEGIDVIVGDTGARDVVREALSGAQVIYHLAALASVARSVADPVSSHDVNATGTLRVLEAAKEAGIERVVYASSSSVYGDAPTLPKHEEMPVATESPYAASKLAGEAYCRAFARTFGLETVSLRFFNVFGPRQDPASEYAAVIPRFVTNMLAGEPPGIFGDGKQSRDFTFVDNVVEACLAAANTGGEAAGEAINVGCGARISLLELVGTLNEVLGTRIAPAFGEPRPGDVRHSLADVSKADRLLGYRPSVTLQEGLVRTVEWFTSSPAA